MLSVIIGAGLLFDFLNGFHDSSNIVATVISSRAMSPRVALIMAAIAHFVAPFIFGVAVATTIGKGVIDPSAISPKVIIAGVIAAVLWNILTWLSGMPSSSSHALIGGLFGAAVIANGLEIIQMRGLAMVLLALFISPPLGMFVGYLFMRIVLFMVRNASPRVSIVFKRLQIFTSLALALSHGTNDAQKTMGILTMGLVSAGFQKTFEVPLWVVAASAGAIALGTALGGWRLIHTLGGRIVRIRPIHGFTSQIASAGVILSAALFGGPVSTTQVVGSAIMGVGAAERISKVRWHVGREMIVTWLITLPVTAVLSAALFMLLRVFTP